MDTVKSANNNIRNDCLLGCENRDIKEQSVGSAL